MMTPCPLLLGLLWFASIFSIGWSQNTNYEDHQVYSYTYHFQHNGTADPKQLVQNLLANPPNGRGAVVKTFWNPDVRGFLSQGYFPSRPSNFGFKGPQKPPTFEGIKKIVEENLKKVQNPTPPEKIKVPPHIDNTIRHIDNEVNRRLNTLNNRLDNLDPAIHPIQGPGGGILNTGRHPNPPPSLLNNINNNNVVTNVKTFEKNLPNGKVFEKVETFSYNPPPVINNVVNNDRNQQVFNHNQRAFGRTVSYFRKEHRTGVSPENEISRDLPLNQGRNQHLNTVHRNFENLGLNVNNNFEKNNNDAENLLKNIQNIATNFNNGYGQRLNQRNQNNQFHNTPNNRFNHNHNNNFNGNQDHAHHNTHNNRNSHNQEHQNFVNNRNNIQHQVNRNNIQHQVNRNNIQNQINRNNNRFLQNQVQQNVNHNNHHNNDRNFHHDNGNQFGAGRGNIENNAHQVFNALNQFSRNNLNNVNLDPDRGRRENDNLFRWDDDNRNWNAGHDWSRRNVFRPENNQHFSNDITSHAQHHNNFNNAVDPVNALKSTLESLTGRAIQFPNFIDNNNGNGNFNNFRGGGIERTVHVDSVAEGPNSYNRNMERRYDRNFAVNSNSGFQFSKRWSTDDLSKLSSRQSKGPTFKKDFIDVFDDEE